MASKIWVNPAVQNETETISNSFAVMRVNDLVEKYGKKGQSKALFKFFLGLA